MDADIELARKISTSTIDMEKINLLLPEIQKLTVKKSKKLSR